MRSGIRIGLAMVVLAGGLAAAEGPLNLALVWHQHQPLYWNRHTGEYELPWVRVHGVQEYVDSPRILAEYPGIEVTYNLQPSLLAQLADYAQIDEDERARGGLYELIGAVDNHLRWTWALLHAPESVDPQVRAAMQEQFFWLNPYMLRPQGRYYDPYYAELYHRKEEGDLTDDQLLDAAGLFLLWQISPELHADLGLVGLRGKAGWTGEDIVRVIRAQHQVLTRVVDAYRRAAELGTELITSPFYHPIVPILAERGWEADVLGQLELAQAQHAALFGRPAQGVWPPEQAVSEAAAALFEQAGLAWTVADEWTLAAALGGEPTSAELTRPWRCGQLTVFFRDHALSDKISFSYGNKSTAAAVDDFMAELRRRREAVADPEEHVVVVALDGENWMFMAGYPDNGRAFLRALYGAISEADWVRTVTPGDYLAAQGAPDRLPALPVRSWAGDLSTWRGEPEEDRAWEELAAAREAVFARHPGPEAREALYAAEGSDWFWWYGDDQDSGTDDLYDWLMKAHLVGAYRAAGYADQEIPRVLFLRLRVPQRENLGQIEPQLDGELTWPQEWAEAVSVSGQGAIAVAAVGYGEGCLYVRADLEGPASEWIGSPARLVLYAGGPSGQPANVLTRHSGDQLGFAFASAVELDLAKVKEDGSGFVFRYAADGRGGWRLTSPIGTLLLRRAQVGQVVEFTVPMEELGIEPGQGVTLMLAAEQAGRLMGAAPERPLWARIPTLIRGTEVWAADDPRGDDFGLGTYVYPLNKVFSEPGLFDLLRYAVYDAGDAWQLSFDFPVLPNPWGGPHGFSHPIIFLYLDTAPGGRTDAHQEGEAAQVAFDPQHPWDYFLKIAGWPAYGRHLWTAAGEGPHLADVASDPKRGRIIVTVPKTLVPEVDGWHYVLVGSQDGYGKNHLRPIAASAGEWVGGGCPDRLWAPQIYDYLAPPGVRQEDVLSAYHPVERRHAVLLPVEIRLPGGDCRDQP
ncbi:MAG: glucodextranase DOMON-like domain-containing protein [Candidatus Bipolaricaulaceae bacterium]